MNVLSLFNGMSVCNMALENLGVNVDNYYSSEIDKYANKATKKMFPNTIQLGDISKWKEWNIDWESINLVTGGFPCQAWSMAGKQLGDKDERGMLFWVMLDIIKHVQSCNPSVHFLIENVRMKNEFEQYITTHTENALGQVHKILINSALVSAQNRKRYYWTSFKVEQPKDMGILLKDIIDHDFIVDRDKAHCIDANYYKGGNIKSYFEKHRRQLVFRPGELKDKPVHRLESNNSEKLNCLTTVQKDNVIVRDKSKCVRASGRGSYDRHEWGSISNCHYRKLTPQECMRLQTIPEHHINTLLNAGISNTQIYKMTGNAWTCDVISHILKEIT